MPDMNLVQYKFMLPASLKERVEQAAKANRRSISQEIIAALEDAYPAPVEPDEAETLELIRQYLSSRAGLARRDRERLEELLRSASERQSAK